MLNLEFKIGGNRFVVLYGQRAYKIPRVKLVRGAVQLIRRTATGQVKERLKHFGLTPLCAIKQYLFGGWIANREEWYISNMYPSHDRARVIDIFFFGLVIVQERGVSLSVTTSRVDHPLWPLMLKKREGDVVGALTQFASFGGLIKLVDLGRSDLEPGMFP